MFWSPLPLNEDKDDQENSKDSVHQGLRHMKFARALMLQRLRNLPEKGRNSRTTFSKKKFTNLLGCWPQITRMGILKNKQTCKKHIKAVRMLIGMRLSITSMSLANRLTMRPIGVVSKNAIGRRKVPTSMPLCKKLEARRQPRAKVMVPTNEKRASKRRNEESKCK